MAKKKGLFSRFFQRDSYMDGLKNIDEDLKRVIEKFEALKLDAVKKQKLISIFVFNYDHKGGDIKKLTRVIDAIKERIKKDKKVGYKIEVYSSKIVAIIDEILKKRVERGTGFLQRKVLEVVQKRIEKEKQSVKESLKVVIQKQDDFFKELTKENVVLERNEVSKLIDFVKEEAKLIGIESSWITETEKYLKEELDSNLVKERVEVLRERPHPFKVDKYPIETMFLVRHWDGVEKMIEANEDPEQIRFLLNEWARFLLNKWAKEGLIKQEYWDGLVKLYCNLEEGDIRRSGLPHLAKGGMFEYLDEHLSKISSTLRKMSETTDSFCLSVFAFPVLAEAGLFRTYSSWKKISPALIKLANVKKNRNLLGEVIPMLAKTNLINDLDEIYQDLIKLQKSEVGENFFDKFELLSELGFFNSLSSWKSISPFLIDVSKNEDAFDKFFGYTLDILIKAGFIKYWGKIKKDLITHGTGAYGSNFLWVIGLAIKNNLLGVSNNKLDNWNRLMYPIKEIALEGINDEKYIISILKLYLEGKIKLKNIKSEIRKYYRGRGSKDTSRIFGTIFKGKKYYVKSLDDKLTLKQIQLILQDKLPVAFYHGTPYEYFTPIISEGALMPLYRLQFFHLVSYFNSNKDKVFTPDRVRKIIKLRTKRIKVHWSGHSGKKLMPFEVKASDIFGDKEEMTGEEIIYTLLRLMRHLKLRDEGGLEEVKDGKRWEAQGLEGVQGRRDPWVVCLFAEFFKKSSFDGASSNYGEGGYVFEIKPSFHWKIIKPISQEGVGYTEYVAEKRILLKKWISMIYVTPIKRKYLKNGIHFSLHDWPEGKKVTKKLLGKYGLKNIPVLFFDDQPKRIKQIRQELQSILDKARGKVKEPVEVMEKAA